VPTGYKAFTAVLALTGSLSLAITGQMNPIVYPAIPAALFGYIRYMRGGQAVSKWTIGALSILTLLFFFFDALVLSADVLLAVAHLTIIFQAIKCFDLRDTWDNLQVFFMSILQIVVTSEFTRSIAFGAVFMVFMLALVAVITLSHFIKEGTWRRVRLVKPTAYISLCAIAFTAVFFVSAPRLKHGIWGSRVSDAIKTVGFNEKVDLGSYGNVKLDYTIVMRAEIDAEPGAGAKPPYYFRGATLDRFDGSSWSDTDGSGWPLQNREGRFYLPHAVEPSDKPIVAQRIALEPLDTDVLFGLDAVESVETESRMVMGDYDGSISMHGKKGKRVLYTVYSDPSYRRKAARTDRYLQFPEGLGRTKELALNITGPADGPSGKAVLVEKYLRENYSYSLDVPRPSPGTAPIEAFLFESKKGYCEHFATAMAVMLRASGVPARIVTGFAGSEFNGVGNYVVIRQKDAHTWVEAAVDGRWMSFDPTPPGPGADVLKPSVLAIYLDTLKMKWNRYVVGFHTGDQLRMAKAIASIGRAFDFRDFGLAGPKMPDYRPSPRKVAFALSVPAALAAIAFIARSTGRRKKKRHSFETLQYLRVREKVRKLGGAVGDSSTPSEVHAEAVRLGFNGDFGKFIALYEEARFGGRWLDGSARKGFRSLAYSLQPNAPARGTKTQ
jgi:transglutaminase-like putative cysteine protease